VIQSIRANDYSLGKVILVAMSVMAVILVFKGISNVFIRKKAVILVTTKISLQ
jgi:hypothetical protein